MPPGVVNGVVGVVGSLPDELRDGNHCVALADEVFQDARQGLRGVEGGVVEEDDGPGLHFGGDPLGDFSGGDLLPVQRVHVPLDGHHAEVPDGPDHMVVILPVRAPDQGGGHAGHSFDLVAGGLEVGSDLLCGEGVVVGVSVGVTHDLVPGVMESFDRLRVFGDPVSYHKEGGLDVVLAQNVDELLGVLIAPGGVEADGADLLIPLHAVDGQLAVSGIGPGGGGPQDHIGGHAHSQDACGHSGGGPLSQDDVHKGSLLVLIVHRMKF